MELIARSLEEKDCKIVSDIIIDNLTKVNSKDYTKEEILKLVKYFTPQTIKEFSLKRDMLVCELDGSVVGTVSLGTFSEDWTLFTFFVDPKFHRSGVGKFLVENIEAIARSKGAKEIAVPSSITAHAFYKKVGYKDDKYLEKERVFLMRKTLNYSTCKLV